MNHSFKIQCVCGGFGFPFGTASTKRVMLMGRALLTAGVPFHVWHIGPSSTPDNVHKKGVQDDITWEYLSPSVQRPENRWLRMLYFLYGCFLLPFRLAKSRRHIYVYCYYQGEIINLFVLAVCRLLHIPVAQECCEWWPRTPDETKLNRWMYHKVMFRWSAGALPISTLIEKRIRALARPGYHLLKVPVLVDASEVGRERHHLPKTIGADHPYLFWCGMVDGYKRDVHFLVRTLGKLGGKHNLAPHLVIGGPCSDIARKDLIRVALEAEIDIDLVIVTGFLQEDELFRLVTHSLAALMPLWDDDRSKTRFPTKLGLYAAAGRPVVTSAVGEIPHYLQDGVTALFATPGDENSWADAIARIMQDQDLAFQLSSQIQYDFLPRVEFKSVGPALKAWFETLQ